MAPPKPPDWPERPELPAPNLDPALAAAPAVSVASFGGRLAGPLPGFARFLFGVPADRPLDIRDWEAIRTWAGELAGLFKA